MAKCEFMKRFFKFTCLLCLLKILGSLYETELKCNTVVMINENLLTNKGIRLSLQPLDIQAFISVFTFLDSLITNSQGVRSTSDSVKIKQYLISVRKTVPQIISNYVNIDEFYEDFNSIFTSEHTS